MTLARIDFQASQLSWTGIGNVSAYLVAKSVSGIQVRSSARLVGGIVGYRIPETRPAQVVSMRTGDLLVITSDGIAEDHLDHIDFAASACDIAEQILTKHAKESDDAMVLAARHRGISDMTYTADFHDQYVAALHSYIDTRDEDSLAVGYELGRRALQEEVSMLDIIENHFRQVDELVQEIRRRRRDRAGVPAADARRT